MDSRLGGGRSGASNSGQQVHYQLSLWISGSLILFYAHDHCFMGCFSWAALHADHRNDRPRKGKGFAILESSNAQH